MEQEKYIEFLIQNSLKQEKLRDKIQRLYEAYLSTKNEQIIGELQDAVKIYCKPWVTHILWQSKYYYSAEVEDILQNTVIAAWQTMENNPARIEYFASFCHKICRNETYDYLDKMSREDDSKSTDKKSKTTIKDMTPVVPSIEEELEKRRRINASKILFSKYCYCFMHSDAFPPDSLALCYARVLPHIIGEVRTAASAKWAFEKMRDLTIGELYKESEQIIRSRVNNTLCWGKEFVRALDEFVSLGNFSGPLKDVVYTSVYDSKKIEDRAEYRHKVTMKDFMCLAVREPETWDLIQDYFAYMTVFSHNKGGRSIL